MIVAGQIGGTAVASLGAVFAPAGAPASEMLFLPTIGLGVLELVTAVMLIIRARSGACRRRGATAVRGRSVRPFSGVRLACSRSR